MLCCAFLLLKAQAPATGSVGLWPSGHFLWFTGHWSRSGNKQIFIISRPARSPMGATGGGAPIPTPNNPTGTPGNPAGTPNNPGDPDAPSNPSGGGTININPDGSLSISNGNVDAWNKKWDQAINSQQQYLQDLQDPGDNLDPTTHQLDLRLQPDAQRQIDELKAYKIDPTQDMLGGGSSQPAAHAPSLSDIAAQGCRSIKADYDMVMNYYKTQVKGHSADLNIPPPPQQVYDCYACDSGARNSYETLVKNYIDNFTHPEDTMIKKGMSILHQMALLGVSTETGASGELGDLFGKAGACSFLDISALSEAVNGITHHVYLRAEKLVRTNKKNWQAVEPILRTFLIIARQWVLLSGNTADDGEMQPDLDELIGQAADHYIKDLENNNWRQIGNLTLIMDLLRTYELMGGTPATGAEYLQRLLKVANGFELTADMDIKIGQDKSYKLAHLKGKTHIIPSFTEDSNQCYKWVIADEDNQGGQGFYKAKKLQTIDCDLLAAEVVSPPQVPKTTYTGTKKYTVRLMRLGMNFCRPGHDTIVLSGFIPDPSQAGTWLKYGNAVSATGVTDLDHLFQDMKAQKELADNGDAEQAQADLQARSEQLQAQMKDLQVKMANARSGATSGADYQKFLQMQNDLIAGLSTPTLATMEWLHFILQVQNNQNVLVHNQFDAKKINPELAPTIIYGFYTIDIVNKGNGKSKTKIAVPATPKK